MSTESQTNHNQERSLSLKRRRMITPGGIAIGGLHVDKMVYERENAKPISKPPTIEEAQKIILPTK